MGMEETALDLIGLAYDAALAPEQWRLFMARLAQAMGSHSALMRENGCDAGQVGLFETVGYDPAYVAAYRKHFVHVDHFAPILTNMPIGAVITGDQAVPWERQRKSEFYNDYMRALRNRHVLGSILARHDGYDLLLALQRETGQPDYTEDDMRLIRLVAPHMVRAAQVHRRVAEVSMQKQWAWSALDRLRVGVVLLDERGQPLHANRAAERLAGGCSGFTVGREGLALPSGADTSRLRRLIADAAALATGRGIAGGGCLRAVCNGATLQFQVIPLPRGLSEWPLEQSLPGGCVAVFVSTSSGPRLPWDRVAAMHGLTRAEAKLAALLAEGIGLDQAAATLSISVGTARSQLKAVFAKTGVTRQAELVALLLADMLSDRADCSAASCP